MTEEERLRGRVAALEADLAAWRRVLAATSTETTGPECDPAAAVSRLERVATRLPVDSVILSRAEAAAVVRRVAELEAAGAGVAYQLDRMLWHVDQHNREYGHVTAACHIEKAQEAIDRWKGVAPAADADAGVPTMQDLCALFGEGGAG